MSYLRSNPHFSVVNTQNEITVQSKEKQISKFVNFQLACLDTEHLQAYKTFGFHLWIPLF